MLSPSTPRRMRPQPIRKLPISKGEALQLWVEHGSRISTRSAVLLSRCVAARAAAIAARTESSFSQAISAPAENTPFRHTVPLALPPAGRKRLRDRRARDIQILREREQAAENSARQAEKETIALVREKQVREAEQREKEKELARAKAFQLEAAELRRKAREAKEQHEAAAKLGLDHQTTKRDNEIQVKSVDGNQAVTGGDAIPMVFGSSATNGKQDMKVEDAASSARKQDAAKPARTKTNPDGLSPVIIAAGNTDEVAGLGKIAHIEAAPEDVSRVVVIWNRLCDEAEPFRRNPSMKKPRLDIKKQINLNVNQLAASVKHVTMKISSLLTTLRNAKAGGGDAGEAFAKKEIAQRLISESDGSVALNRTAAFAVGAVIVGIAAGVQDPGNMRDVFLGAFYKHCMYTTPAYSRRPKSESTEDYRRRIGYKHAESAESYLERSCGCVSLFAAVLQTEKIYGPAQRIPGVSNPFSLDIGWTWLARIANKEQHAITPAITIAFLEVAGYYMSQRYRKQFAKLIAMVQRAVVLKAAKSAPPGPSSRLDTLLEDFIRAGCTFPKPPHGRELPAKDLEFL